MCGIYFNFNGSVLREDRDGIYHGFMIYFTGKMEKCVKKNHFRVLNLNKCHIVQDFCLCTNKSEEYGEDNYMIKSAVKSEARILAELAIQMWKDNTVLDLEKNFEELIENDKAVFFIKYVDNTAIGFAQCQIRSDYVEGTKTSPVGYLEGIFIVEAYRHSGYAKELLRECEKWAKDKNCSEFASDCEWDNIDSLQFHMAMGFEEANRIICFKKNI